MPTNQSSILGMPSTVFAPYLVELVAMIILGAYLLLHDGTSSDQIINALIAIITANGGLGTLTAVVSHFTTARVQTAQAATATAQAQSSTPQVVVAPGGFAQGS